MEIISAAANDIDAIDRSEHPYYVINNFGGPVASVAQGSATVGSVTQTLGAPSLQELVNAVAGLIHTLPEETAEKAELTTAREELEQGRVPVARIGRTLTALSKGADLASRAPQAIEALHHLCRLIGV